MTDPARTAAVDFIEWIFSNAALQNALEAAYLAPLMDANVAANVTAQRGDRLPPGIGVVVHGVPHCPPVYGWGPRAAANQAVLDAISCAAKSSTLPHNRRLHGFSNPAAASTHPPTLENPLIPWGRGHTGVKSIDFNLPNGPCPLLPNSSYQPKNFPKCKSQMGLLPPTLFLGVWANLGLWEGRCQQPPVTIPNNSRPLPNNSQQNLLQEWGGRKCVLSPEFLYDFLRFWQNLRFFARVFIFF